MRKNHIYTNSFRTIKKAFPRFLSLVIMSLLGVMVFSGLQATSPDMLHTLDNYYDQKNVYDIKVMSSMGLIEESLESLKKLNNIKEVEGSISKDILLNHNQKEYVLNISSLPTKINIVEIVDGKLPSQDNEIVVEENYLKDTNLKIGDTITLDDEEIINKEVTIVGTIVSPLHFNSTDVNQTRGASSLGTGSINYYSYMPKDNFDIDYYTSVYLTIEEAQEKITSKEEYVSLIDNVTKELNDQKSFEEEFHYNKIYNEANEEILKNEKEAQDELKDVKKELDKAKKKLNSAKKELDSTKKQLNTFKNELSKAKKELDSGKKSYQQALKKYNIDESKISSNIKTLKSNISSLENIIISLDKNSEEYLTTTTQLSTLKEQLTLLEQLNKTKKTLNEGEKTYNSNYAKYQSANKEYKKGLSSYNKGVSEYEKGLKEYKDSKKEAEEKISDAKKELADIEKPTWYIYDRRDDQNYSSYIDQTISIKNLSAVFPVVFYAVSILISLISMNRMVEDDRGEIGTLKSLGFSNREIMSKYIIFSLSATLIGGLIGIILGLTVIPSIIFFIYKMLYILPNFHLGLNLTMSLTGIMIAIICICGATIITTKQILKEKPATIMRPKAPKSGKKIFLENFKSFWHNIKFSNKITIRNIFRYKKRVAVTIFGISGCTALMLCGFGIKDSMVGLTNMQYGEIFTHDATVYVNDFDQEKDLTIFENENIKDITITEQVNATYKESDVTLLVAETSSDLENIVNLTNNETNEPISLTENKVLITEKLATLYNIEVGDTIEVLDNDKNNLKFTISGIVKNYIGHYIYMDKETFISENKEFTPNIIYLHTENLEEQDQEKLSSNLLTNDTVINVVHTDTQKENTKEVFNSLDQVVLILILLAAMLSFVVLYNLSNINITERKREIATLKVLGFYDKEVDNYINKETIILTIIGIVIGLGLGSLLTKVTITTVEMDNMRFLRQININSYIFSAIISSLFTVIVNFVTHFSLKKINMIESLKSVE